MKHKFSMFPTNKLLHWSQPSALKKHYELRAEDDLVATLEFRSIFGSYATGESAGGCWTMKRTGFWRPRATVRECDTEIDIADFRDNTWSSGGTLTLAGGRQLFATTSFWKEKFLLQDEKYRDLILLTPRGLFHASSAVEIYPLARKMPELPWMVMLGWYLTIQKNEEEGAAAAAACV